MSKVKLKFARKNAGVIIPSKREEDAGFDIYANFGQSNIVINPNETKMIPTGIISSFPSGYVIILKERGSTGSKGIGQRCGVIDSGYRDEWFVPLTNHNNKPIVITKETNEDTIKILSEDYIVYPYGKAICQAILLELPNTEVEEVSVEDIMKDKSERGKGSLGSSGK